MTAGLLLLGALLYGQLLVPGQVPASAHSDFIHQHLAIKDALHRSLATGLGPPLWRSDQFAGVTAWSNPQAQYTYPFHALFWVLPPVDAVGPTLWLHLILAGLGLYALGAALEVARPARLLMAVAGLCAHRFILAVEAGWLPVLSTMTMVPLVLASLIWVLRRTTPGSALALCGATSLALVTGGLQLCYYTGLLGALLVLSELVRRCRALDRRGASALLLYTAGAIALAAGLSAHLWLPLAGEAPLLSRGQLSYDYFLSDTDLHLADWASLLSPSALGLGNPEGGGDPWERCAYFGLVPLLLAGLAFANRERRRDVMRLGGSALLALLLTLDTPLLHALYDGLPGFSLFRGPARFLLFTTVFGIALAGLGAEVIFRHLARRPAWTRHALLGLCALAMLGEAAVTSRRQLTTAPRAAVLPDPELRKLLARDRSLFRVATLHRDTLNYGWSSSFGLQLIHGGDAINYRHYKKYFNRIQQAHVPPPRRQPWNDLHGVTHGHLLDALGVRYLVTPFALADAPPQLEPLAQLPGQPVFRYFGGFDVQTLWVYRNKQALPRAFFVAQVEGAADEDVALERITTADLATLAVVEPPAKVGAAPASPGDRVRVKTWRPGALRVELKSTQPRFVVISEIWHPGWRARLDDQPLALAKTDVCFLGAWVPPGSHELELEFRPRYWHAAWILNALAGAIAAIALWRLRPWRHH